MLYSVFRPLLFTLPAEQAHCLSLSMMDKMASFLPTPNLTSNPTQVMGITFPNKVGLAAGLDKNGGHLSALGKMGFGFIEVGTVTPRPQAGNPKPRLFRLPEHQAIINRMGFNNVGVDKLIENVKKSLYQGILGINIGKNKETPNTQANDDYLICLRKVYLYADYITANISSPNTVGLRELQEGDSIKSLISALKEAQVLLSKEFGYKPIVIKIAPDLTDEAIIGLAEIFKSYEIDGVIATNTTLDKTAVNHHRYGQEQGGLSGLPLKEKSTRLIRLLADELAGEVPIIGVGGIISAQGAKDKLAAGASLIQLYSGLIYQGPALVNNILRATEQ
ncbi:MAG: quinone-dependent dihydroorotate dehydrogenase [Ostreibacterium sp.]